jgi:hypothetical protein
MKVALFFFETPVRSTGLQGVTSQNFTITAVSAQIWEENIERENAWKT